MATITITENLIANLNKFSKERDAKYLDSAVKNTINLFGKQVSKQANNNLNEEAVQDFGELITMYKYTNTPQISDSITDYYNSTIKNSLTTQQVSEQEVSKRVA